MWVYTFGGNCIDHLQREEPPKKITKLAISAETDEDRYNTTTSIGCYSCDAHDIDANSGKVGPLPETMLTKFSWQKWLTE